MWDRRAPDDAPPHPRVANETVAGTALRDEIVRRAAGREHEVLVVTPGAQLADPPLDVRRGPGAREAAEARLDVSVAALAAPACRREARSATTIPIQAIDDALRAFPADEIVISTHPPGRSNWLERDLVGRARERYECPITHVVVDLAASRPTARAS